MIRPRLRRSIPLVARLATRHEPPRFVSTTAEKSSSDIRMMSWSRVIPALATSTSTGPCSASTCSKAASTDAGSVTSQRTPNRPAGRLSRPVGHRDPVPAGGEGLRDGQPDAAVAAGDQHRPARVARLVHGGDRTGRRVPAQRAVRRASPLRVCRVAAPIDPAFTALPLRSLADAALARARELGAEHADFRLERIRDQHLSLHDARLDGAADSEDIGFAVRVVHDGLLGLRLRGGPDSGRRRARRRAGRRGGRGEPAAVHDPGGAGGRAVPR